MKIEVLSFWRTPPILNIVFEDKEYSYFLDTERDYDIFNKIKRKGGILKAVNWLKNNKFKYNKK